MGRTLCTLIEREKPGRARSQGERMIKCRVMTRGRNMLHGYHFDSNICSTLTSTFKALYFLLKASANSQTFRVSDRSRMWTYISWNYMIITLWFIISKQCKKSPTQTFWRWERGPNSFTLFPDSLTMSALASSALSLFLHTMWTVPPVDGMRG